MKMSVQRHKCFLCLDTVSTGKLNRPYYKVHLENIHNVRCNVDRLLNWVIEQRPIPNGPSSSRASSTLSSVANLMGMKGITITKDTTSHNASPAIPDTLINIKGITVQKVSDDIQIIDDSQQQLQQQQLLQQRKQQHQLSPGASSRLQNAMAGGLTAYSAPSPRGGAYRAIAPKGGIVPMRGGMMVSPRGRALSVRGGSMSRGMVRPGMVGRGGQNSAMSHNTLLKQQEAAIEKWANSCEHGCRICRRDGKSFTTLIRQNLVKHIETIHTITEKEYKAEFKVHSLITRASNVVCALCSQKVKRLPVSLSTHMKKHKMTIRQYWMKYVAPQGSPLATFQPRPMGGPVLRGGGHPAMRGMSPIRGASPRGRASMHGMMRRGGGPMGRKDNIVIGEVFSVNGSGSTDIEQQEPDAEEIEIDEKNILLHNTSSDVMMEVELDPLAMLSTSSDLGEQDEDSKDFIKIEGVPVKAEPDEQKELEPVEVDMQAIRNRDVKPVIKIEKQDPDLEPTSPEKEKSEEPEEESSSQEKDFTAASTSGETEKDSAEAAQVDTPEDNNDEGENFLEAVSEADNEDSSNAFQIVSCEGAGMEDGEDAGGEGGEVNEEESHQQDARDEQVNTPVMESDDASADENTSKQQEPTTDSQHEENNIEPENDNEFQSQEGEGEDLSSDTYSHQDNSHGVGETEASDFYDDNATNYTPGETSDHVQTMDDFMPDVQFTSAGETEEDSADIPNLEPVPESGDWTTMSCPYSNPQCPVFCCHVRALQEVQEGSTDWIRPYGPPANGGDPCTCCVND